MKKRIVWPPNNQVASAAELVEAVVNAFKQGAEWKRRNEDRDIVWRGPKQGKLTGITSLEFSDWLKADNLRYSLEDQGRDFLTEILIIMFQIGIEQGRRIVMERGRTDLDMIKMFAEHALSAVDRLADKPIDKKKLMKTVRRLKRSKGKP